MINQVKNCSKKAVPGDENNPLNLCLVLNEGKHCDNIFCLYHILPFDENKKHGFNKPGVVNCTKILSDSVADNKELYFCLRTGEGLVCQSVSCSFYIVPISDVFGKKGGVRK